MQSLKPVGTLFGVPQSTEIEAAEVAVLGVPFDMGSHPNRIGARGGPAHVRAHSLIARESAEDLGVDSVVATGLVDCGDVDVTPGQVDAAFVAIEQAVGAILDAGTIPLVLGGDGAVTLPQLRAVSRRHEDLVVLHVDGHTDAYDWPDIFEFNNANSFVHAAKERLVDPAGSYHVAIRDTDLCGEPGVVQDARDLGYRVITMNGIDELGIAGLVAELREALEGRPVYLCWDMDCFDPSVAPGVVTPAWGGLTAREGMRLLQGLRGLDVVAFDLNTVSPPHDLGGQTGSLAASVALEFLAIALHRPAREPRS